MGSTQLIGALRGQALRVAAIFAGSREDAEDAVQEANVRFLQRMGRLPPIALPEGYYLSCVVNEAKRIRSRTQRQVDLAQALTPFADRPAPHSEDPQRTIADRQVWNELDKLPDRQQQALALRYYLQLDVPAVAALLECRESTVRSLLSRGVSSLRKVIEQ